MNRKVTYGYLFRLICILLISTLLGTACHVVSSGKEIDTTPTTVESTYPAEEICAVEKIVQELAMAPAVLDEDELPNELSETLSEEFTTYIPTLVDTLQRDLMVHEIVCGIDSSIEDMVEAIETREAEEAAAAEAARAALEAAYELERQQALNEMAAAAQANVEEESTVETDAVVEEPTVETEESSVVVDDGQTEESQTETTVETEVEDTRTQLEKENIPSYSIGIPGGEMKPYLSLTYEELTNAQYYVDQGNIIEYGGYYAGHNPGVFSFLNWISVGDVIRVSYGETYEDLTVIDYVTVSPHIGFGGVYFNNGLNLWDDVCYGPYSSIQFCLNGSIYIFLLA